MTANVENLDPNLEPEEPIKKVVHKINSKIVSYQVKKPDDVDTSTQEPVLPLLESMNESIKRPEVLHGSTYKIKNPSSEHALYVTINDYLLNVGTADESRHPFEIFVNSKNMEHFQWVLALTRLMSAVFRKGGNMDFLVGELQAVFDPKGGYFKKGIWMPSLVAEIGYAINQHLLHICKSAPEELAAHVVEHLAEKRKEFEALHGEEVGASGFPAKAVLCVKCNHKAMVLMDGCMTCLNCGDSKCG